MLVTFQAIITTNHIMIGKLSHILSFNRIKQQSIPLTILITIPQMMVDNIGIQLNV